MGGWKCSYRNCKVNSEKSAHLFHYPVFDRARCLKWLANAHKLEYLDLKVSQLKNRVICQHHFKDECFMNYKKDKLIFDAVPTENGNFCDPESMYVEKQDCPITFEDIHNAEQHTLTAKEKKANYSIRYGEFLTDPILHSADNVVKIQDAKRYDNPDGFSKKKIYKLDENNKLNVNEKIVDECTDYKTWSHRTLESKNILQETPQLPSQSLFSSNNLGDNDIKFFINVSATPITNMSEEATPNCVNNSNSNKIIPPTNLIDNESRFHINVGTTLSKNIVDDTPSFANTSNNSKLFPGDIFLSPHVNPSNTNQILQNLNPQINKTQIQNEVLHNLNNTTSSANLLNSALIPTCRDSSVGISVPPDRIISDKSKIKIISEKRFTGSMPVAGTFEPVCPSRILNPRKKTQETKPHIEEVSFISTGVKDEPQPQVVSEQQPLCTPVQQPLPANPTLVPLGPPVDPTTEKENLQSSSVSPCAKNLKNKIPPERVAAIEEKRLFNKKLRDMIEFCLDDKEENNKVPTTPQNSQIDNKSKNTTPVKSPVHELIKDADDKRESEITATVKEASRGSQGNNAVSDYKLTVLEAKLSRMENLLLKKVGENTQRIQSLKQIITESNNEKKKENKRKSIHTQTVQDKEMHKKHLFQEISLYLTPELNSLIYEELFMKGFGPENNALTKKSETTSPVKRKRRK